MKKKVLVAMSGGVDSSVAAFLLKEAGYECIGCTMKLYGNEDIGISKGHTCCSLSDVEDARSVAYRLGMPYYVFNFTKDFKEKVIDRFVDSYLEGKTPNPCIDCNRFMKFDLLYERARVLGCDYIATGHYARIEEKDGKFLLKKGMDDSKDQSYVLYQFNQEHLAHTLFPVGNLSKAEVRRIAEENGFLNASKPDSQDICFVPDGDYARVIRSYTDKEIPMGEFKDKTGKSYGKHKGIIHYTIGQRKGLGISNPEPLFVCRIDAHSGDVIVGKSEELFSDQCRIKDFNLISDEKLETSIDCYVKIRYAHKGCKARVIPVSDNEAEIRFEEPQRAVTPGQRVVLYDSDVVLGGGTII